MWNKWINLDFNKPDPDMGWRREDVQTAFVAGMETIPVRRLLSLPEAASVLSVSPSTIHGLVRRGQLAFVHAGQGTIRKHLTFSADEIESFIKRHTERLSYSPTPKTARRSGGTELGFLAQRQARITARAEARKAKSK
ncbi:helix-turn-helix transcriptional regulator [Rhizobium mongolense]|uniref:DNA-binding transcriptional regulator AlpA n=3 Tax=Rhizobium mongolense TaxID=57676 RepID=A0ABR6ILH6_9HYPH|nr:helix-turn-helix domain-containing protein [Rhizobium mongolense]MBB4228590.1 putative DNA-binding transcriptional regulator AlpA [Rhizobium mongolense]TVZ63809.1 helix-turn-helix protein [Rhizobium mongolense USDA 1844]